MVDAGGGFTAAGERRAISKGDKFSWWAEKNANFGTLVNAELVCLARYF